MRLQWAILIVRHKVTKSTVADKAEWRRKSRRRTVEETAVAAAAGDKERNRAKVNHSRAYFYRCSVRCSCALLCVCVLACDENLSENISGMCWWCRSGNYAYTSNRDHRNRQQYNEHSIISCSGCQRRRRRRRRCRHPRLSPSNTAISEFYFIFSTNSWRMWYMSHVWHNEPIFGRLDGFRRKIDVIFVFNLRQNRVDRFARSAKHHWR